MCHPLEQDGLSRRSSHSLTFPQHWEHKKLFQKLFQKTETIYFGFWEKPSQSCSEAGVTFTVTNRGKGKIWGAPSWNYPEEEPFNLAELQEATVLENYIKWGGGLVIKRSVTCQQVGTWGQTGQEDIVNKTVRQWGAEPWRQWRRCWQQTGAKQGMFMIFPKNNIVIFSSESCLHENLALFHYADANAFFGHISVEVCCVLI